MLVYTTWRFVPTSLRMNKPVQPGKRVTMHSLSCSTVSLHKSFANFALSIFFWVTCAHGARSCASDASQWSYVARESMRVETRANVEAPDLHHVAGQSFSQIPGESARFGSETLHHFPLPQQDSMWDISMKGYWWRFPPTVPLRTILRWEARGRGQFGNGVLSALYW